MSFSDSSHLDLSLIVAQGAPPLSGTPTSTGTAAPGGTGGATGTGGAAAPNNGSSMLLFMFAAIAILMIVTFLGNRRETKRKQELLDSLKKNDRVQTIGGIIGTIFEVKPDTVVLKVDEGSQTKITIARAAVVGVIRPSTETSSTPAAEAAKS